MRFPRIIAILTLLIGCSTATMKPPPGLAQARLLVIQGHSGNTQTFRDKDLKIGSYAVTNIDRDWNKGTKVAAGPWSRDSQKRAYRFDVKASGRTVHAECTEQTVANDVAGFGNTKVSFACACNEGDTARGKLDLVNGIGAAKVGEATSYEVSAVFTSEQGPDVSSALGYHFRAPQAEGAVDITGKGRAWTPASASEEELLGLVCSYAGLLLYRPTQ